MSDELEKMGSDVLAARYADCLCSTGSDERAAAILGELMDRDADLRTLAAEVEAWRDRYSERMNSIRLMEVMAATDASGALERSKR